MLQQLNFRLNRNRNFRLPCSPKSYQYT